MGIPGVCSDEQRREGGCSGGQSGNLLLVRVLRAAPRAVRTGFPEDGAGRRTARRRGTPPPRRGSSTGHDRRGIDDRRRVRAGDDESEPGTRACGQVGLVDLAASTEPASTAAVPPRTFATGTTRGRAAPSGRRFRGTAWGTRRREPPRDRRAQSAEIPAARGRHLRHRRRRRRQHHRQAVRQQLDASSRLNVAGRGPHLHLRRVGAHENFDRCAADDCRPGRSPGEVVPHLASARVLYSRPLRPARR